jgi:hypothetical protein
MSPWSGTRPKLADPFVEFRSKSLKIVPLRYFLAEASARARKLTLRVFREPQQSEPIGSLEPARGEGARVQMQGEGYVVLAPLELREDDFDVAGIDLAQNFGTQRSMVILGCHVPPASSSKARCLPRHRCL